MGGWVSGHLENQGGLQELDTQFWLSSMFWREVFFLFVFALLLVSQQTCGNHDILVLCVIFPPKLTVSWMCNPTTIS